MTEDKHSKFNSNNFVPFSARLTAAMRAKETLKANPLFKDPFASSLAGSDAFELLEKKFSPQDIVYLAVRTRYFDDFILSACTEASQLVILGAGMDTRAYRLSLPPHTVAYELDQSIVLDYKTSILQAYSPKCERYTIEADLTQPWEHLLLEKGFNVNLPSIWLLEGLLMYLTKPVVDNILSTISTFTTPGSKLGLDTVNLKALEYEGPFKGHFQFGINHPEEYLSNYGWKSIVKQPGNKEVSFNRFTECSPPEQVFFVTAQKA